tara:strand:- start:4980 stop:5159 length:180 start_codon:yes stop_codon:yes gene_type:complete
MKSFISPLILLFVGLKLTNCIDWSWWWVFSPVWVMLVSVPLLAVCCVAWSELTDKAKNK